MKHTASRATPQPSTRIIRACSSDHRLAVLLVVLAVAAGGFAARAADAPKQSIAHRGASGYAPEHTRAAYQLALDQRADFVEQDLAVTRDGVLICLHDDTLERTSNVAEVFPDRSATTPSRGGSAKRWFANDFTLDEIRRLDMGRWFNPKFAGERIVTWQEAVDLVRGKAGLYPELKSPPLYTSRGVDMVKLFVESVKKNGLDRPESLQDDADHRAVVRRADRAADGPGTAERPAHPADGIVRRRHDRRAAPRHQDVRDGNRAGQGPARGAARRRRAARRPPA